MKIIDLDGNAVADDVEFIASKDNGDGSLTAFFEKDVDELIRQMAAEGAEMDLPVPMLKSGSTCKRQGARNCGRGSCPSGTRCTLVSSGSFSFCRCR